MKCFRCNFVPFFLQTTLKVGNSTESSLSHFALQNAPHILYWRQVGTAGRPVKYPYPLPPQPGLCNVCRMWFCIVLLKYAWTSLEKMSSWRQHIVLQNLYVLFSINGAITEVQVTFAKGTDTTPYHDRPWLLDLLLVTVWMILFFFGPQHTVSIPPKKYLPIFLWGTLFLNISIIFSRICWQTGDPRPIFAPKGLDLSWMLLLYQIIITITCWHQLFQITSFNQFTSLLALNCSCPNFFWNVLQVWMTGKDVYLQMTWSWPDRTWNILCSYCLQWNTSQSKFRNHYFFFICVFHTVPTFSDLGLYM